MTVTQLLALCPTILSTVLSSAAFFVAWKNRMERGGRALLALLGGLAFWSLCDLLSTTAGTETWSLFWLRWLYLGVCLVPAAWLMFSLRYSGRVRQDHIRRIGLLMIEPVLLQAAIWTNPTHRLFWVRSDFMPDALFPTFQNAFGPIFWAHTLYSYTLIFIGMIVLLRMAQRRRGIYRGQAAFLTAGVLFPLAGNAAYIFGFRAFGMVDLTAPAFTIAALFLFIAFSRFKLMRVLPVTREDVFKTLDMAIFVLGDEDRLIDVNQAALHFLELEEQECLSRQLVHLFPEWEFLRKKIHEAGGPIKSAIMVRDEERIFEVELIVSEAERPGSRNSILIFHDITQHELHQRAVFESQKRFQLLFEYAPSPYYIFDLQGRFVDGNRAAEVLSGYTRGEVIGKTLHEIPLLNENKLALAGEVIQQLKQGNERPAFMTELVTRAGEIVPVEVKFYPIELDGKTVVLGMANDVKERLKIQSELQNVVDDRTRALELANTELQENAHELERTIKGLKRFAYVASHDLQEPLRMVSCYTQLLEESYRGKLDPVADEYISYAVEGAKRMQNLIRDLIKFTHIIEPRGDRILVDCEDVIQRTMKELDAEIEGTGADITVSELPSLLAYDGQLEQLFFQLLDNALKFQPDHKPEIQVRIEQVELMWQIAVSDNGIGIENHFYDRIFEIFRRLHGQRVYPGTGVGLALCRQIVENHQGRIWVESEPGIGSTFYFTWPQYTEITP